MHTSGGRYIQIEREMLCQTCRGMRVHVCFKIRYRATEPAKAGVLLKIQEWVCSTCHTVQHMEQEIPLPSDKQKVIDRIMRLQPDYDIAHMRLTSAANKLTVEFVFK